MTRPMFFCGSTRLTQPARFAMSSKISVKQRLLGLRLTRIGLPSHAHKSRYSYEHFNLQKREKKNYTCKKKIKNKQHLFWQNS